MSREDGEGRYCRELSEVIYSQPKKLTFTEGARDLLDSIILDGARQLATDGTSGKQLRLAQENARALASEITEAGKKADYRVDKSRVNTILKKLCPIYPFCKGPKK